MNNVDEISKKILSIGKNRYTGLTNKQLQKLLFIFYGIYIVLFNKSENEIINRPFENKFEAWVHGPVYPEIYSKYKKYGFGKIIYQDEFELDKNNETVVEFVLNNFGILNANELEAYTHSLSSWRNARGNLPYYKRSASPINDKDIYNDFKEYVQG